MLRVWDTTWRLTAINRSFFMTDGIKAQRRDLIFYMNKK